MGPIAMDSGGASGSGSPRLPGGALKRGSNGADGGGGDDVPAQPSAPVAPGEWGQGAGVGVSDTERMNNGGDGIPSILRAPVLVPPRSPTPSLTSGTRTATDAVASLAGLFSPASPRRSPSPSARGSVRFADELDEYEAGPSGFTSRSTSIGPASGSSSRRKKAGAATPPPPPTLVGHLPTAWDDALASFDSLERCVYERKDLGLSREQDEMMVCDCTYDPDQPSEACGHDSDCINRAIFIECLAKECRTGKHCQNQRLSRRQYAPVDIVLTEKKGFGLRAKENIPAGSLIYEYIGEVVVEKTFRKRMADYAAEGIKHFYFMMLQKEEYIDATKKGGIGRFANHSCNPNCEVQKWVVGRRMRMGIFTKRDVLKDEEITFNYNVDRYGHEAQICYCGEYNCVGTIGGKTQTDIGGMDDLLLDALGILDEVNINGLKGSRKKKARQLDEDYVPILRPMEPHEAPKVSAAIRQSLENPLMLSRLLERVQMTAEPAVHRQLMRMHGFSIMSIILTDMVGDRNIVKLALDSMERWKSTMTYRNKVEDSGIQEPVRTLADGEDAELAAVAKDLLDCWSKLELSYKIPRVSKIESLDEEDHRDTTTIADFEAMPRRYVHVDELANTQSIDFKVAPVRAPAGPPIRHRPLPPPPPPKPLQHTHSADRTKLNAIIAMAAQAAVAPLDSPAKAEPTPQPEDEPRKRQKTSHSSSAEDAAKKEKRLTKLVGEVVVRSMSKYKDQMEHDTFKKYAKECTALLVDKEKRGHSYTAHRTPRLSDEKKAKIKSFTKDYAHKLLRNLKAKGKLRRPGGAGVAEVSPSTPAATPSRAAGSSLTPGKSGASASGAASAAGSTPRGSVSGDALLTEMFGEDDDVGDDMDMDMDGDDADADGDGPAPSLAPDATPSASVPDIATPVPSTPPSLASPGPGATGKPVVVEHAKGPFLPRSGPILVDRFEGPKRGG